MKFLVVFAVVLISASAKAQDESSGAGTDPNASGTFNSGDLNSGSSSPSGVDSGVLPGPADPLAVPTEQQPPVTEVPTTPVPSTTTASNGSFGERIWKMIEEVVSGSETIPMAILRAQIARLNRNLYNIFDYKLVILSDCPELKTVDLGKFAKETTKAILLGENPEKGIISIYHTLALSDSTVRKIISNTSETKPEFES
ncbi:hypothetical protein QAD02_015157 [Eretmocerus hayati]|uniref:Uncharacterized protein n=1 Tax=Eretmocerus hayati TaxID=131215 RepID=A0ACC2P7H7_9HYME|nr:hypothetical protein QAD02_015157 [Eretmocerus hayati]